MIEHRNPETQFQVFDVVVYLPEGIITKIVGYNWIVDCEGGLPALETYQLACGISAPASAIARHEPREPRRSFAV